LTGGLEGGAKLINPCSGYCSV